MCDLCLEVVPNTVTFTEKRSPCAGGNVREMRTDESLERDGRPDERRVGRLEAVALERPEVELVVEPVLGVELGHEVLHGRRRAGRAVRRAMRRVRGVRQVRHGLFEADVVAELQRRPVALRDEDVVEGREHSFGQREDDDGPPPKKKVAALLRQADENLSAPVEDDDDDVVDLTV